MNDVSYVALIVESDGALTVHGPCTSALMANLVAGTIRIARTIFASTARPLVPPAEDLEATLTSTPAAAVIDLPDVITDRLAAYRDRPPATPGPAVPEHRARMVVWVTTAHGSGMHGVLIGPFADVAHAWIHLVPGAESGRRQASFPLPGSPNDPGPVRPITAEIIDLQPPEGTDSDDERAVVAFETDDVGWQVYGPFADQLQATAYCHAIGSALNLTNVRGMRVLPVNVPDPRGGRTLRLPPTRTFTDYPIEPTLPHIVVLTLAQSAAYAIGWFADAEAAKRWLKTQPHDDGISSDIHPVHEP